MEVNLSSSGVKGVLGFWAFMAIFIALCVVYGPIILVITVGLFFFSAITYLTYKVFENDV